MYIFSLQQPGTRALNVVEVSIVSDFEDWFSVSMSDIEFYLPNGLDRSHLNHIRDGFGRVEVRAVDNQVITGHSGSGEKWTRIADAQPWRGTIRIYSSTEFWIFITENYEKFNREVTEENTYCEEANLMIAAVQPDAFGILCHEYGHIIGIEDHIAVYDLGSSCKSAAIDRARERVHFCLGLD